MLLLKDLHNKFDVNFVLAAMVVFAAGVVSAAYAHIFAHELMTGTRRAIKDYVFNDKDIGPLQSKMDNWDNPKAVAVVFVIAGCCFLMGVLLLLVGVFNGALG